MRVRRQEGVAASGAGQLMSMTGLELTGMEDTGMHAPDMQGACLQVAATQTLPHQRHTWTSAAGESLIAQVWVEGSRDIAQRSSAGWQESLDQLVWYMMVGVLGAETEEGAGFSRAFLSGVWLRTAIESRINMSHSDPPKKPKVGHFMHMVMVNLCCHLP